MLITGASQLLTLRGGAPRRGNSLSNLGIVKDGALLVREGKIAARGHARAGRGAEGCAAAEKLDVGGRVVLPGFVDSHTHLIHAASRAEEYELKIQGASYEEIARKGGGILNSVKKLRAATRGGVEDDGRARRWRSLRRYGTTTVEAKSGYGLDVASELKILRLQRELKASSRWKSCRPFWGRMLFRRNFAERRTERSGTSSCWWSSCCRKW